MKNLIWAMLMANILLILSGTGWIVFGSYLSLRMVAFNYLISPAFLGGLVLLFGIFQGVRLRKVALNMKKAGG